MEAQKGGVSKLQQLSSLSLPQLEHMKNQLEEVGEQDGYRVMDHRCVFCFIGGYFPDYVNGTAESGSTEIKRIQAVRGVFCT